MIKNSLFWQMNMAGALAGWLFIIAGLFMDLNGTLRMAWWIIALLWVICHPLELVIGLPIAQKAGFSNLKAYLNIMVFGITWWIPVKLGVIKP